MATVTHVTTDDGYHHIGVKDGKAFIPFVSLAPGQYEGLKASSEEANGGKDDNEKGGDS